MTVPPEPLSETPEMTQLPVIDPLASVLETMKLSGGVFLEAEFSAPWCILARVTPEDCGALQPLPTHIIAYHYVAAGRLFLQVAAQPPVSATAGDIILMPRNDPHKVGNALTNRPADINHLIQPAAAGGPARIEFGGGGEQTRLLCGFLGGGTSSNLLLTTLPGVLIFPVEEGISRDWITHSFRFAASESGQSAASLVARLAETLFLEAIRRYIATMPAEQTGWLAGLRDPVVGQALALLHSQLAHNWTTEELASACSLSRSAFAQRFTALIGMAPMGYLGHWRMQVAADRLRDPAQTISRIAYAVGYESESAFNRAFKREFGLPPAAWKQRKNSEPQY